MTNIEVTNANPNMRERLEWYGAQVITIANTPQLHRNLNDFILTRVQPDVLEHPIGAELHRYAMRRISGISARGTMVHVRTHQQKIGEEVPVALRNVAYVGSLSSSESDMFATASRYTNDGPHTIMTELLLGYEEDDRPESQLIEPHMTRDEWRQNEIEQFLLDDAELQMIQRVRFGKGGQMQYQQPGERIEPLRDILRVQQKVRQAVNEGLGNAALTSVARIGTQRDTGQLDQNMVA